MEAPGARWDGPWPTGWTVHRVDETGSTNADLAEWAADGAPARTVLVAGHQRAGRGRLDRVWEAPPGENLLVSLLFRHDLDRPHRLVQRVALAAADACEDVTGIIPELKWPNDLLVEEAKLAGILAQAGGSAGVIDHVVVGLGLNVGWAPPGAARLGRGTPGELLTALLAALDRQPANIAPEYARRLGTLGRQVRVELPDRRLIGTATGVDDDGALSVEVDGDGSPTTVRVLVGDVIHLRVTNR